MNRYVNLQRYQPRLYTPPVDIIGKAMEYSQQQYNKNLDTAYKIKNNFIPSLPQDRKRADQLQEQYNKAVDDVTAKYHGDYAQATNELNQLMFQIKKDFGPGGEAGAIIQNHNTFQNWLKESQDLVEKGKALGEDVNQAYKYEMSRYQGVGQRNPETGTYNSINPETLTEYVDPEKLIIDAANALKPRSYTTSRTEFKDGKRTDITTEASGVTYDRMFPAISSALLNNPKYMAYLQQKSRHLGVNPDQALQYLDGFLRNKAVNLAYTDTKDLNKTRWDEMALLHERSRLQKKNLEDVMTSFYQHEPTTDVLNREQSIITPDNFWQVPDQVSAPPGVAIIGGFGSRLENDRAVYNPGGGQSAVFRKQNFAELLKDPLYIQRTGVDKPLAEATLNYEIAKLDKDPARAQQIYNSRYGKDPNWTKTFDKEVVTNYKKNEINNSRFMALSQPIVSPKANEEVIRRYAGLLLDPKRVSVYQVGNPGTANASEFGLSAKDLIGEDGILPQASYVKPGPGYVKAGFQIPTKRGTFVFVDQDTGRQDASKELERAMNPIFFYGKQKSDGPVRLGYRGDKPVYGNVESKYIPDGSGLLSQHLFAQEVNDKLEPVGEKGPISLEWLYRQYDNEFQGAYGAGASKSDQTLFPLLYELSQQ